MAGKKQEMRIAWPLAPSVVRTSTDTNLLKFVGMLAMLCDHAGKMLFPQYRVLRLIGRMAFPIYAYCLAVGCVYTHDMLRYFKRLALLALVSQPLYAVAMAHTVPAMYAVSFAEKPIEAAWNFYIQSWAHPNILFTLGMGLLLIWSLRERHLILSAATFVFIWLIQSKLDYGIKGICLMLLFYLLCGYRWLSLPCVLALMVWWGLQGGGYELFGVKFQSQMFAVLALPLIYLRTNSGLKLPKWLFYGFYPAHLVVIYLLDRFVM